MRTAAAIITACSLASCSMQEEEQPAPVFPYFSEEGGRVRDLANVLDPAFEADLTAKLDAAERQFGYQAGVVTVPSLHGYTVADFSLYYARAWGLGNAQRNDGLMILVAPSERQVRIEVGSGIETAFSDVFCKQIIDEDMIPSFATGDYQRGIAQGAAALVERMRAHPTISANDNEVSPATREDVA